MNAGFRTPYSRIANEQSALDRRFDRMRKLVFVGIGLGVLLFILGLDFTLASATVASTAESCTVEDKDRTTNVEGGSDARVYTSCGVFSVGDNLLAGHFSSADTYSSIKVGETYDFELRGFRIPLLSSFPNIISVS